MFPAFDSVEEDVFQTTSSYLPWTYKFDWATRQLVKGLDGRYLKTTTYAEYLEETAKKILNTKRFQYLIYSDQVGVDFLSDRGKMRSGISLFEIKQQAQEALEAHPEIERAEVIDIRMEKNSVIFSLELEGARGKTKVVIDIWQR